MHPARLPATLCLTQTTPLIHELPAAPSSHPHPPPFPPTPHPTHAGVPASQKWLERRSQLAAEHAAAGQFSSAMSLLFRQLGVVAFEPLKPHMLELYNASHAVLPGLQVRGVPCCCGAA